MTRVSSRARAGGADWPLAAGLIAGAAADAVAGDPRRGHPVAAFGQLMTALEQRLYADAAVAGAGYAAAGLILGAGPAAVAAKLTRASPAGRAGLTAAAAWAATAARTLHATAGQTGAALEAGDLGRARTLLPSLCGRDPGHLDQVQISRAVIESVAENCSDAVVAPLVWGALAGPAGMSGYRAVNTMDAMVGHHSPRYERFGSAAARLDDVANWVPARLTALLAAACAPVAGGRPTAAWRTACQDGPRHPSPNAGWCEAAFAGALGICLGGTLSYSGRTEHRPVLGSGRAPQPGDIPRAIRLSRAVTASAVAMSAVLAAAGRARAC